MTSAVKSLWHEIAKDRVSDLAAGLAYRFLLALFPFFIFMAALSSFIAQMFAVDDPSGEIVANLAQALPEDAQTILTAQLAEILENSRPGLLSFGIVGALWSASSGIAAAMRAMNIVHDVEEARPFWRRTLIAIGLTVLSGGFILAAFVVLVGAQFAESMVAGWLGTGPAVTIVLTIARYAVALALIGSAAAFLYWALPNAHLPFRWLSPGAALFVLSWVTATALFGWYVSNFGSYNATYGALGGLIVLMVWLYVTALMLLVGAEVNALVARSEPERERLDQREPREPARQDTPVRPSDPASTSSRPGEPTELRARRVRPRSRIGSAAAALTGALVGATALARAVARPDGHRRPASEMRSGAQTRDRGGLRSEGVRHG